MIIKQLIENIKAKYPTKSYKLIGHKCQNFVDDVKAEYKNFLNNKTNNLKNA